MFEEKKTSVFDDIKAAFADTKFSINAKKETYAYYTIEVYCKEQPTKEITDKLDSIRQTLSDLNPGVVFVISTVITDTADIVEEVI